MKVAIIGGGAFGSMTALKLAQSNHQVTLFERLPELMSGASYNNQNRLHLGFHYPRDDETARQCIRGFARFRDEFPSAILSGFPNAYFIASAGSHTTPEAYLEFCSRLGLSVRDVDIATFRPSMRNVEIGVYTEEVVYDSAKVRDDITQRLNRSHVTIRASEGVVALEREGAGFRLYTPLRDQLFDAVINCCYADINRLTADLGHKIASRQYEYTAIPVIEIDLEQPTGITILDGPFMTLLPFGQTGRYLLYHVGHSVIDTHTTSLMDPSWLDPENGPFAAIDQRAWYERMINSSAEFIPQLINARQVGALRGPRMVLANGDATDARPSVVTEHEPGYVTVFAGKVDHCVWVADEVAEKLAKI